MDIPKEVLLRNPLVKFGMTKGRRQGVREGRQHGEMELVLRQLSRRLGAIAPAQEKAIRKLSLLRIEALGEALLDFRSKADFSRRLRSRFA